MTETTHAHTPVTPSAPDELDEHHAAVIRATLPLVGANIDAITTEFYRRLFEAHPSLKQNLFNRGNQARGAQQRALAGAVATFATHLVDPDLPHPVELLSRIGHKHASLGITADQYSVVHENLFAAIVEILGADVVSADVAAAWDRVYWMMADTLIDLERRLYEIAGVEAGDVFRRVTVTERVDDPSGAVSISVEDPAVSLPDFTAAQYVSVGVTLPDGARQLRQYSLVGAPATGVWTFTVKPVDNEGTPAGEVSTWIRDHLRVGDTIDVTLPFGDLASGTLGSRPVVLVSAGIGITPMIGILEFLAAEAKTCKVLSLHADRSEQTHPLRERHAQLISELPSASLDVWYEQRGLMDLSETAFPDDAEFYLCGNVGFTRSARDQLTLRGIPGERVHTELFAPDDWLV
ncbi:hemin transporter [Rhodococcus sp. BP-252]|uniref:globin domain-containing protein n=1 Tax=unclassified Rhodococcus (in: high G+C Gram-positive bacteria) TaxID=192944 RepID=UPI001C9A5245|nr:MULTISPECIES: globin domain-containing protein [unclassified Rhodococcus (in: high G+C Gram-positive bacteria)]MBY6414847.1 hemin transporter [Rhodococcus sp. BP-320]MBY6419766.1 hemin transporter [Rhodococcus sp. BP-321]MBY6423159.1 hemin transporter [Rhodococcus sp. BP-324]MBY6429725.1 hemin transporter [Rhodococcus sp. BP-323]MBY6434697.1 hemin transporter [Rhodococcus sp. BP-322]